MRNEAHSRRSIMLVVAALLAGMLGRLPMPAAEDALDPRDLLRAIESEVNVDQAMKYMRDVYSTDRWFTFPKFHETADYLDRAMARAGLTHVEKLEAPADGVSQFGYWTMPLAWDARRARLEIVEPAPPEEFRVLADYETIPASLGMWSGPTPEGGVVAEVIALPSTKPEELTGVDLSGKLVLVSRVNAAGLKWLLVKKGALGAINAFTENRGLQDGRQWVNAWGDAGWGYTKQSTPLVLFSITPRQEEFLRKLLAEHGVVKVKAEVDSRYYAGTYPYVTGVLPGTENAEEVLTLGHTAEQGAHDNATGVAAMLEALGTLHRLIEVGKLPPPRRTIRMLAMGEYYATHHYIAAHGERIRNTVAAFCVDTPAASYDLAGTEYTYYLNPHVAKSYTDALILKLAELYFPGKNRPWHWKPYMAGTDTFLADPTIGVPTVWPYSGTGIHTHHNSEDKPETVDPRSLRDLTVTTAAYLYYIAAAGERQARWLAEIALTRGLEQLLEAAAPFVDRAAAERSADELGRLFHDGKQKIDYTVGRERQALFSVLRLVPEEERKQLRLVIEPLAAQLTDFGQALALRLERAVRRRGVELEDSRFIRPVPPPPGPKMAEAAGIIVKRKRFGTIPLDDVPVDQREGYPNGAWSIEPITLLYWCDGKRDLAEVTRLTELELGRPVRLDVVGYFQFLNQRGYVEFVKGNP